MPLPASRKTVTVLGAGAMGMPMGKNLVAREFGVVAVDPSADARKRAEQAGMGSAADIGSAPPSDVVIVLVATGQQLLDVAELGTKADLARGQTWIVSSTVGPRAVQEAAAILSAAGAKVIDAPVTGGVPGAENGALRFLTAGDAELIESLKDLFSALGQVTVVSDRIGDGQATKIVNQLCSSVHLAAAGEAIALASRLGLDPVKTVNVISGGSGASWFFDERGPRMAKLDEVPPVLTRLAILKKDNELVGVEVDAIGAHAPLLKAAKKQYERAAELGLLEADDSQIIRTYLDPVSAS